MDAFVDFHYVTYNNLKDNSTAYFINEIAIITFLQKNPSTVLNTFHSTFKFPNLKLNKKCWDTYMYNFYNFHGLDFRKGDRYHLKLYEIVKQISKCDRIFVRGQVKRDILKNILRDNLIVNITTEIGDFLKYKNVKGNGNNLPGYVTYDQMLSYYNTIPSCKQHSFGKCIMVQCEVNYRWFVDNYYRIVFENCCQ